MAVEVEVDSYYPDLRVMVGTEAAVMVMVIMGLYIPVAVAVEQDRPVTVV
jgi:hypothetical protein